MTVLWYVSPNNLTRIQICMKIRFIVLPLLATTSLRNFANTTAAVVSCAITGSTHSIKKCTKPTHVIMVIFSKMCCRILLVSYSLRGYVLIRDGQYNSRVSHVACTPVPTLQTSRSRKSQLNITYRWLSARKT